MNESNKHNCVSCGNPFDGRYCNVCGEKILEDSERTVLYFISVIFHEVTSVDSKLWLSIKTILANPGQLSSDYANGKRNRYMRPITLFFLGNVIYFLLPVLDTYNTLLQYHFNMPYTNLANIPARVDQAIIESGLGKEAFYLAYNTAIGANSKLMLILLVPITVPPLVLIGWQRRKLLSEHLMFALELNIFVLYFTTMLMGYLMLAVQTGLSMFDLPRIQFSDLHFTATAAVMILYFLTRGIKRFYDYGWFISSVLALLLLNGFYMSLVGYRWLLFEVTMAGM